MNNIQVIVATMDQKDFSKVTEMNISTDVVFANQTNETSFSQQSFDNFNAKMISTQTQGVGTNRNIGLQYATGDIILLADDDMVYEDNYAQIISKAFDEMPQADAIVFNIITNGQDMGRRLNQKSSKVRIFNCLNYGAVRIAVRRRSLVKSRISFSTCFGGGTIYSAGEDSLFICDMLRNGLKLYTYPETIATVDQTDSTWFKGYNEKFIYDKGAFFGAAFGKNAFLMCLQYLIRHSKVYKEAHLSLTQAFSLMLKGAKGYKTLTPYKK